MSPDELPLESDIYDAGHKAGRDSILDQIDEVMQTMRPRYVQHPTMDGRYPCWIVWLPVQGTTERKTLKEAVVDFIQQSESAAKS